MLSLCLTTNPNARDLENDGRTHTPTSFSISASLFVCLWLLRPFLLFSPPRIRQTLRDGSEVKRDSFRLSGEDIPVGRAPSYNYPRCSYNCSSCRWNIWPIRIVQLNQIPLLYQPMRYAALSVLPCSLPCVIVSDAQISVTSFPDCHVITSTMIK